MNLETALRAIDPQEPDYHETRAAIFARHGDDESSARERWATRTLARLKRFKQLDGRFLARDGETDLFGRWDGGDWRLIDPDDIQTFAHTAGVFFAPGYCHHGDYDSIGTIGIANCRSLEAIAEEYEGACLGDTADVIPCEEVYTERHYAYGGVQALVAIRADTDEILDALEGLAYYPLIDDECHSEVETEEQNESWERFYRDVTIRETESALGVEWIGDDFDTWLADLIIPAPWDAEKTCSPWDVLTWENHGNEMHLYGLDRLIEALDHDSLIETGLWAPEEN